MSPDSVWDFNDDLQICDPMYRVIAVSTQCGHTFCVQCAVSHWVRGVTSPPRFNDQLALQQTQCPVCRGQHPEVRIVRDASGYLARSRDCVPFHRNIKQDTDVESLLNVLKNSIRRLVEIVPDDINVQKWSEAYCGDVHTGLQKWVTWLCTVCLI